MAEIDLVWMTLLIFAPAVFGVLVLFFPKGTEEYMRWFTLLGTTVTMVISIILFINYLGMLGFHTSDMDKSTLAARVPVNDQKIADNNPRLSDDLVARYPWIDRFNIDYFLGADGISMPLILLTTVIFFFSMIASWNITRFVKGYCALFLLLETGVLGTFLALDFFLFYIFWEVMLLPMYFLIGVWGGPRREYAAIKFFLYTLLGSVFILIAMLAFYFTDVRDFVPKKRVAEQLVAAQIRTNEQTGASVGGEIHTFDLVTLAKVGKAAFQIIKDGSEGRDAVIKEIQDRRREEFKKEGIEGGNELAKYTSREEIARRLSQPFFSRTFQYVMFLLLFVGFAIKVPVFPFHTWLPDAHVEAPTPISMILAGILLKLGGYGILRIAYPICPWAAYDLAFFLASIGMVNIVYGAFAAMAQTDFKKLVAYSSISHMGYVVLGIAVWPVEAFQAQSWVWGLNGAMYQMIGHGISSAGMFFMVGVIYDRAHHRNLNNFRGLFEPMPLYGGLSAIIFFAALGLPGLCGFVGEFMVVLATWNYSPVFAVIAALVVVITAAYILWTLQRVYFGVNPVYKDYPDVSFRETLCAVPLCVLAVVFGIMPQLLLNWMEPHLRGLINSLVG